MKLTEIFDLEEKLLYFEDKNKYNIPFNDYLLLDKILTDIGNITNRYFQLINSYNTMLIDEKKTYDERRNLIEDYNKNALNDDIEINLNEINKFKKKYSI